MANKRRDKGSGSYRQLPNGTWQARYKGSSCSAKTEAEIKKRLKALVQKVDNESQPDNSETVSIEAESDTEMQGPEKNEGVLLADWLNTWMKDYKKLSVKPGTYTTYLYYIDAYIKPNIGHLRLSDIKEAHIQSLFSRLTKDGLKAATVTKVKNIINNSLNQAVKNRFISYNPTQATVAPKAEEKEIMVFTPEEQKQFIEAIKGNRFEALFHTALSTGMRRGELIALKWENIDYKKKEITVAGSVSRVADDDTHAKTTLTLSTPKTRSSKRKIPMTDHIEQILLAHQEKQKEDKKEAGSAWTDNGLVFCSSIGTYIEPRKFKTHLDKALETAGIKHISFHALRHTFATRMLENGASVKALQEILGHADASITLNTYAHLVGSAAHNEIQKINGLFDASEKTEQLKPKPHRMLLLRNKRKKDAPTQENVR